jgi:hypothetical protein
MGCVTGRNADFRTGTRAEGIGAEENPLGERAMGEWVYEYSVVHRPCRIGGRLDAPEGDRELRLEKGGRVVTWRGSSRLEMGGKAVVDPVVVDSWVVGSTLRDVSKRLWMGGRMVVLRGGSEP